MQICKAFDVDTKKQDAPYKGLSRYRGYRAPAPKIRVPWSDALYFHRCVSYSKPRYGNLVKQAEYTARHKSSL